MEELVQEIRLLRQSVEKLTDTIASRPTRNGAWKARQKAEAFLSDFQESERKAVGLVLNRIEWLKSNGNEAKFDDGLIVILLGKQGEKVERQWAKDVLRKMIMKKTISWEPNGNGWEWKFGEETEKALSEFCDAERKAFFKALYFQAKTDVRSRSGN